MHFSISSELQQFGFRFLWVVKRLENACSIHLPWVWKSTFCLPLVLCNSSWCNFFVSLIFSEIVEGKRKEQGDLQVSQQSCHCCLWGLCENLLNKFVHVHYLFFPHGGWWSWKSLSQCRTFCSVHTQTLTHNGGCSFVCLGELSVLSPQCDWFSNDRKNTHYSNSAAFSVMVGGSLKITLANSRVFILQHRSSKKTLFL